MSDELIEALRREVARTEAHDILKLRSDVNHLLQPIVGELRLVEAHGGDLPLAHFVDRLYLVLALMDEAATGEHTNDEHRARHGVGQHHYPSLAVAGVSTDAAAPVVRKELEA